MNHRQVQILQRILVDPQFYTTKKLAALMGRTERTVYNDLLEINDFLNSYQLSPLELSEDKNISPEQRDVLSNFLKNQLAYKDYELTGEERIVLLLLVLLITKDITIDHLAEILMVSRSTLLKDLKQLRQTLEPFNVTVISKSGRGIALEGEELALRDAFLQLYKGHLFILRLFVRDSLTQLRPEIASLSHEVHLHIVNIMMAHKFFFTEESLEALRQYILLVAFRPTIEALPKERTMQEGSTQERCDMAKAILPLAHKENSIAEVHLLAHFMNSLYAVRDRSAEGRDRNGEFSYISIQFLVTLFLEKVSDVLGYNLIKDRDLIANLTNHMTDIAEHGVPASLENSSIRIYMEKNMDIVEKIGSAVGIFESYLGRTLSDLEIAYIALHVSAAIEKLTTLSADVRVLLVCNSGIGTVQLLKAKLLRQYKMKIVDTIQVFELYEYDLNTIDCVIATVPLPDWLEKAHITVSVNLPKSDFDKISDLLRQVASRDTAFQDISGNEKLKKLLRDLSEMTKEYPGLYEALEVPALTYWEHVEGKKKRLLSDFMDVHCIALDETAKDWQEAIQKTSDLLLKEGYVDTVFAHNAIKSVNLYGPYIVIGPGVAFPHGGFEQGALKTGFSLLRLKEPVVVDDGGACDIFIGLSAADNTSHLNSLYSLMELVGNTVYLEELRKANSAEDVLRLIRFFEEHKEVKDAAK
ncbi:MAG: PTS sugar transporter subunit IIA [Veillonella sp.]|uniref:BglG family transcription antiterminator n=1 Tax=Veillonella sp. TaxID=1926307 RepID=UPI0025FFBAF6|nr:PTS sugar transporter subunit IIA [Veillonella sp.]MBS4912999.1 PTS sugar transporter subunit IIA [Veillonella sp.]